MREDVLVTAIAKSAHALAGFLLADEERGVIVLLLYNDHNDDVGHVVIIPRPNVVKITQLRPGKGFRRDAGVDHGPGKTGLFK